MTLARVIIGIALGIASAMFGAPSAPAAPSPGPASVVAPAPPSPPEPTASAGATVTAMRVVVPGVPAENSSPSADQFDGGTVTTEQSVAPGRVATPPVAVSDIQTVGITWDAGSAATALAPQIRSQDALGAWTPWQPLDDQAAPDAGTKDESHAVRGGSEPLWVGDVAAVQLSVSSSAGHVPDGLSLDLVGSPSTKTVTRTGALGARAVSNFAASAAAIQDVAALATGSTADVPAAPRVISRSEWGAPAQVCAPDVADGLVGAVLHHTADSNAYSTVAEAEQMIRNDATYHMVSRGWCDLGYNFVVDKWGNIYEGRAGSLTQPVIGVHTGGFNTRTVGVALLGTYDSAPSAAAQSAVATIIGWRLGAYRVDPRGTMSYATGDGENSRFHNETVTLPRVFGHRDVAYTSCPGNGGYASLPGIRDTAWNMAQEFWGQPPSLLMRSPEDATVYLVSGGTRYPIADLATLASLAPIGPVTVVPRQYLASWIIGPRMRRVILAPDGTVSFLDAGIRLAFGTCAQVADFGYSCGDAIPLEASEIAALHNGGRMHNLYRTTSGKAFYVIAGAKREIADDASFAATGWSTGSVTLLETGLAYLPYGDPVVRQSLRLDQRDGSRSIFTLPGGSVSIPGGLRSVPGMWAGESAGLDTASMDRIAVGLALGPFVTDPATGAPLFLSERGRWSVSDSDAAPHPLPVAPAALVAGIPNAGSLGTPAFIKSSSDATVYVLRSGVRRAVRGWGDLLALASGHDPVIAVMSGGVVSAVPDGGLYNPPGTLARTAANATVFLLDGDDADVPVATFAVTAELGATRLAVVPDSELAGRTQGSALGIFVRCGTTSYVGLNGRIWPIGAADVTVFPLSATVLQPATCDALPHGGHPAERFWRTADGTIYLLDQGAKHPIASWGRFLALGGSMAVTANVSDFAASQVPTEPLA